jgi:hypothetical protein
MNNRLYKFIFLVLLILAINLPAQISSGISVNVDKHSGRYTISSAQFKWNFEGSINHNLEDISILNGKDIIGDYKEIKFSWNDGTKYRGGIRWYQHQSVILFSLNLPEGISKAPEVFPSFTKFPRNMNFFSYVNDNFAPPEFNLNETSTPWLFFDDKSNSFIVSPASDFMVSKMSGDGKNIISSGLNEDIKSIPDHFAHSTILVISKGIRNTWNLWGSVLRKLYTRSLPTNDADPVLKYFGYWTDNGADYYYNYDTTLGYANTLLTLGQRYEKEGIPLGYMQLDSWWYEKSIYDVNGKPDADHKNPNLPYGKWNRYGGIMSYSADPDLFKKGLSDFQKELDLPLATHSRWIDPNSPYHEKYKISGYAAVDPKYWKHIISYLKSSGVVCYEQDWLNYIYEKSPELSENISAGNEFTDGMANACKDAGLTMQYCMAMPRFFLQGLKYNNLTTIRTSGDRFGPDKWKSFLYTSMLAYECGIYPWCDVFKSNELNNLILAVLSAGPVGTGDAIGKEDKANIMMACRKDGVLVKPDVPALPVDTDFLNDAKAVKSPMLACTYSMHSNGKTVYIFVFESDSSFSRNINFNPLEAGIKGNAAVYSPLKKTVEVVNKGKDFTFNLNDDLYSYYIIAPISSSGIALWGDSGKIAAAGKERILDIVEDKDRLKAKVLFAEGEAEVNLIGYSIRPLVSSIGNISYNPDSHIFNLLLPNKGMREVEVEIQRR